MPATPATKFNRLKKSLRAAIDSNDTSQILMAVMKLGEYANNQPADWKMGPRTFYEFADVLRQMRDSGQITEAGQDQILKLLQGGNAN